MLFVALLVVTGRLYLPGLLNVCFPPIMCVVSLSHAILLQWRSCYRTQSRVIALLYLVESH